MSLESLLNRANEAVGLLTTMGWAPAENIAQQNASDMQSIYNALAAQVQGSPIRLNSQEKHVIFELSCRIWVCSSKVVMTFDLVDWQTLSARENTSFKCPPIICMPSYCFTRLHIPLCWRHEERHCISMQMSQHSCACIASSMTTNNAAHKIGNKYFA